MPHDFLNIIFSYCTRQLSFYVLSRRKETLTEGESEKKSLFPNTCRGCYCSWNIRDNKTEALVISKRLEFLSPRMTKQVQFFYACIKGGNRRWVPLITYFICTVYVSQWKSATNSWCGPSYQLKSISYWNISLLSL